MRLSTAFYERLVDFVPDALLVVDAGGQIVFANSVAETLFGFTRNDLIGSPLERLVPQRLRSAHTSHRSGYFSNPRSREMGENSADLLALRADGTEFPVEIRLSPMNIEGQPLVAAAVRDVTARFEATQAVRAARDQAQRANAAKGRFLAAASHDLRQPLQTLVLLAAALQRTISDPAAQDLLANQQEVLESMSRLLNTLLDISKLEAESVSLRIEEVGLALLFDDLRREFESVALARGLTFSVEASPLCIRTDRTLFRELMENLISNAIKYTPSGRVRVACEHTVDGLLVSVSDTGIGIAADAITSIFDEFYQVDRYTRQQGAGLGLAIVKRVAALLGLSISVVSEPGRGSDFRVGIPASQISGAPPPPRQQAASRALPGTLALILLVEDDDAVRHATALYLKAMGYAAITAASIAEAEEVLRHSARHPDLIISDYHLGPTHTGVDLIQRVRMLLGKELPALLLSGDTSAALHDLAASGTFRLLSKPVNADQLGLAIAQLLQGAEQ